MSTDIRYLWGYVNALVDLAQTYGNWMDVYHFVFNGEVSQVANKYFDWYDPDMSYQDDIMAFYRAFENYMNTEQSEGVTK